MGGAIAALYAEKYPTQVSTLIFWGSPLGISPYAEPFKEAIYQGINPLIPTTPVEFLWKMNLLFYELPNISRDVIQKKIQDYKEHNKKYTQIWNIVNLYIDVLNHNFSFNQPVFILWGDKDVIFDVSGATKLANQFQDGTVSLEILESSGHLPYYDAPDRSAEAVIKFLAEDLKCPLC